jgi:hypothetical protein
MISLGLRDLILESLTPSVQAPSYPYMLGAGAIRYQTSLDFQNNIHTRVGKSSNILFSHTQSVSHFRANFHTFLTWKMCSWHTEFTWKNSHHSWDRKISKNLELPDCYTKFPTSSQNVKRILKNFLLLYLVYSQIWLNLLRGSLPVLLHHKFEKENPVPNLCKLNFFLGDIWCKIVLAGF